VASGGDFPSVCYGNSFVYAIVAQASVYEANAVSGLREISPIPESIFNFAIIPDDEDERRKSLDDALSSLAGVSLVEAIEASDYGQLKAIETRRPSSVNTVLRDLIRPHPADAGNISIQLRSTAEFGALLRLIRSTNKLTYVLVEGTMALPFVGKADASLFYEHLKRLCCVESRKRGIGFFTISKAHGLPLIELVEEIAREHAGAKTSGAAEHWYLRMPVPKVDRWDTTLTRARRLPPPGAVTYLVRFHRTTPTMRLDMDREYWLENVRGATEEETRNKERGILGSLDYLTHDQRCYGYPYPLRAANERAKLTRAERTALRKQIIDAAVHVGLKRSLFRESAQLSVGD
jgi:hypothetical protein